MKIDLQMQKQETTLANIRQEIERQLNSPQMKNELIRNNNSELIKNYAFHVKEQAVDFLTEEIKDEFYDFFIEENDVTKNSVREALAMNIMTAEMFLDIHKLMTNDPRKDAQRDSSSYRDEYEDFTEEDYMDLMDFDEDFFELEDANTDDMSSREKKTLEDLYTALDNSVYSFNQNTSKWKQELKNARFNFTWI